MQIIQSIRMEDATDSARRLLETVNNDRSPASNMVKAIANSPLTLEGYLQFRRALSAGQLAPRLREQIALTVAQANHSDYSLAQHAALAGRLGLTSEEILASRQGRASDDETAVVLRFSNDLVVRDGDCSVMELRKQGYSNSEIVEIVAHVALNVFENYFNTVAQTELDFPEVQRAARAA